MSDLITVQGMVISSMPMGEYDRRIVLLTRERGKIPVFARGARRPSSPFLAAGEPYVFGTFSLYEGRTSYNLHQVSITHQFSDLAKNLPEVWYGYYFLELADYFGCEGIDATDTMNLLFVTVKALLSPGIDNRLVRCVYEFRLVCQQGMMPSLWECVVSSQEPDDEKAWFSWENHGILLEQFKDKAPDARPVSKGALLALRYIAAAPLGRLYSFEVSPSVLSELERIVHRYTDISTDRRFKSLKILESMS